MKYQKKVGILILMLVLIMGPILECISPLANSYSVSSKKNTLIKVVQIETKLKPYELGKQIELPAQLVVKLSNGKSETVKVKWLTNITKLKAGTHTVQVLLIKYNDKRTITLQLINPIVKGVSSSEVTINYPIYPNLYSKDFELYKESLNPKSDVNEFELPQTYECKMINDKTENIVSIWDYSKANAIGVQLRSDNGKTFAKVQKPGTYVLKGKIPNAKEEDVTYTLKVINNFPFNGNFKLLNTVATTYEADINTVETYMKTESFVELYLNLNEDISLEGLESLPDLQSVLIRFNEGNNFKVDYSALAKCKKLWRLTLLDISPEHVESLPELPNVKDLMVETAGVWIENPYGYKPSQTFYYFEDLDFLYKFPNVKELCLQNVRSKIHKHLEKWPVKESTSLMYLIKHITKQT